MPTVTPQVKLVWASKSPIKATGKAVELLITGTNDATESLSLNSIQIMVSAEKHGKALVTSTKFEPRQFVVGEKDRPVGTASNVYQLISTASTVFGEVKLMQDAADDGSTHLLFIARGGAVLAPGNSVTLALLADTGAPGTYSVRVLESWPPIDGKANRSLVHGVDVVLQP